MYIPYDGFLFFSYIRLVIQSRQLIYTIYGTFYYNSTDFFITSTLALFTAIIQRWFMYPIVQQIVNGRIDSRATTQHGADHIAHHARRCNLQLVDP